MSNLPKRIAMSVFGVFFAGVAVGLFKMAAFGVDPFQTFASGLNSVITISFGTLYTIINIVLLLFSLFACKRYIGIATFINLFLLGYVVEYSHNLFMNIFGEVDILGRIIFLVVAIVVICFASSFYIVADLGVSTYDAISLIIANEWKKMKFKYCRILTDFICVAIGTTLLFVSGATMDVVLATVGIGTIITAFFMGPLIDLFIQKIARPFLLAGSKDIKK